jgi:acyl-coenzyme A thioesterase PaaI-like protein|tara:strand:+ start:364 stop:567 length:204 start_codon:yes stop_codon:yes gene_type:complete
MDLTVLPCNALIGIQKAKDVSSLLTLKEHKRLHNHLDTLHASALFSLAEASSAEFLLRHRGECKEIR